MCSSHSEPIEYACLPAGIVIIRVSGKGTFQQSGSLFHVFESTRNMNPRPRYIIDLDQCGTMDSTFMGTLASIGIFQRREVGSSLIVTNIRDHVRYLFNTLGLQYILDIRKGGGEPSNPEDLPAEFKPAAAPEMSQLDRIVMMIQAHERLIDANDKNEIKFEGVLKSLRESLEREKRRHFE